MADLASAKRRLLAAMGEEPWFAGVGVGLVGHEREKGLVVSLGNGAPEDVRERIEALVPDVPLQVRGLPHVHKLSV